MVAVVHCSRECIILEGQRFAPESSLEGMIAWPLEIQLPKRDLGLMRGRGERRVE